ncbi:uncharacterized protein L3040_008555 [Drepanopeziza brunnea f. sp. 'multigermtubi']|uniref:uncharacterized protein n=1 Tax=Drepanopeziza brunnea f. sp. 'multigermtubi' TaxID=698441 RepID=UPI00239B7FAA|nr:hypothetical protein L3040_008555 [Drepanopeziza brunnea f. sp. 'multigermtubi']
MSDNHARASPTVEAIAGFTAGVATTVAVHPLDVIKTRLQIQRKASSPTATSALTIFRTLISSKHPLQSLYRGTTPNLIGNASSWSLFFYSKSLVEQQLASFHARPSQPLSDSGHSPLPDDPRSALTPLDYFVAASLSGGLTSFSTNPIWVIKTRMLGSDRGAAGAYSSIWHGAREVMKNEGLRGFYRGFGVSLLNNSHGAVQFAVYDPLRNMWKAYSREEKFGNTATMLISGAAKIIAGTVTYPFQVVRSRSQMNDARNVYGEGITGVVAKIWKEEGASGFYRGLGTSVVRVLPATWVTFLVYENVKYYLSLLEQARDQEIGS